MAAAVRVAVGGTKLDRPPVVERISPKLFGAVRAMAGTYGGESDAATRRDLEVMMRLLRRYGQQRAVVLAPDGRVLAEGAVWRAARALGWTQIAAVVYAGG